MTLIWVIIIDGPFAEGFRIMLLLRDVLKLAHKRGYTFLCLRLPFKSHMTCKCVTRVTQEELWNWKSTSAGSETFCLITVCFSARQPNSQKAQKHRCVSQDSGLGASCPSKQSLIEGFLADINGSRGRVPHILRYISFHSSSASN